MEFESKKDPSLLKLAPILKDNILYGKEVLSLLCSIFVSVNVLKFLKLFSFHPQIKYWFSGLEFTKCLSK